MTPRLAARAFVACVGLTVGLAVAELGFRISGRGGQPLQFQAPVLESFIAQRAGATRPDMYAVFTYDRDGFRVGSDLPYDRTVLFIGDSFTEGRGVADADTFPMAAERVLRSSGISARSLNAGQRGFGAAQELVVLRRLLAAFHIDAIVVQSFPQNDLSDNVGYGRFGIEANRLVEYDPPRPPLRARLARAVANGWLPDLYVLRAPVNATCPDPAAPFSSPVSFDLERMLLAEMVATARAHGIAVVVLVVPTRAVQQMQSGPPAPPDELERFTRVRAMVENLGVPWIDAGKVIPDLAADAALSDGSHFSPAGNDLIGHALAAELVPLLRDGNNSAVRGPQP